MAQKLNHIHVMHRTFLNDVLFGFVTNTGSSDIMVKWDGTQWQFFHTMAGTNLKYDAVTWRDLCYVVDGKNAAVITDGTNFFTPNADFPIAQYITVYQDRLVAGGDARTESEVTGGGGVWPDDSNRNRILYCETLDPDTWAPNNFLNTKSGTGYAITGLAVNAFGTSDKGAQSQLVIFKSSSISVYNGELGGANVELDIVSDVIGMPDHHAFAHTDFGLCFVAQKSIYMLKHDNTEPQEIGFMIANEIDSITYGAAMAFDKNTLKVFNNASEWFLDMRPAVYPQEQNWYGPLTGDHILQYEHYLDMFVGAEINSLAMWELDIEDGVHWTDMDHYSGELNVATDTPRTSIQQWNRAKSSNMMRDKIDAAGMCAETDVASGTTTFNFAFDINRGQLTDNFDWVSPSQSGTKPVYAMARITKQPCYDVQVAVTHNENADFRIHSIYLRAKTARRQSEKQDGSTQ